MDRITRRGGALVAVLALVALGTGCGSSGSSKTGGASTAPSAAKLADVPFSGSPEQGLPAAYPEPQPHALTVGLLNPLRATEVLASMFDAATQEVHRLGGRTIELDANLDPDKQVSQFQQLINRKVDAIGIYAIAGPKVLGPLLQQAAQAHIPVIGFDVTPGVPQAIPGFASQVWQQRDRLTYLQVKAAADVLPKGSELGQIGLALPVPIFQYTSQRQAYWAGRFGLKIVGSVASKTDATPGGEEAATALLAQHAGIKGILGYNDEPAIGAALAARASGRNDVAAFGVTGGSLGRGALKSGRLKATVSVDAPAMGVQLADGLYGVAEGTRIPPVVVPGSPRIVTQANASSIPTWDDELRAYLEGQ